MNWFNADISSLITRFAENIFIYFTDFCSQYWNLVTKVDRYRISVQISVLRVAGVTSGPRVVVRDVFLSFISCMLAIRWRHVVVLLDG